MFAEIMAIISWMQRRQRQWCSTKEWEKDIYKEKVGINPETI
jgi:hypothetical protein